MVVLIMNNKIGWFNQFVLREYRSVKKKKLNGSPNGFSKIILDPNDLGPLSLKQ